MVLRIETFDNARGGNTLYKALTHPHVAAAGRALVAKLAQNGPVALVDPQGALAGFAEIFGLDGIDIAGFYVQDVARLGDEFRAEAAAPVTELVRSKARLVFVAAFDAERLIAQFGPLLPDGAAVVTLDAMRLPDHRLSSRRAYLDPVNFATNFALFRDEAGLHTRLVTANYWAGYGSADLTCWLTLFDAAGRIVAEWDEHCGAAPRAIAIDSREVRARFGLDDFAGQLFLHAIGAAGHDVVKYALDVFGDEDAPDSALSCTHDANAWPADRYAGLPAPGPGERVVLWVQNSHPTPIPPGAIALAPMGNEPVATIDAAIPPFASKAVDIGKLLPGLAWPRQIEIRAGKHVVRPRYEVICERHRRIAHVNVERDDLRPDPQLPHLAPVLGKGYVLPAPILPRREWESLVLPTPMAVSQAELPIAAIVYDPGGREIARQRLGRLPRAHATALPLDELARELGEGYGHVELVYDFRDGGEADGWLHALFRYSPARRPARGRHELRRACIQHGDGLPQRAAILCRPAARVVDAAVPAARKRELRHALSSDLPGVLAVARAERDGGHPLRRQWGRNRTNRAGDSLFRLPPAALSRAVRRRDPRSRREGRLRDRARPNVPAIRLSRAFGPRRRLQSRPHVRVLSEGRFAVL